MGYDHIFTPGAPGAGTLVLLHGTGGDKEGFDAFGARVAPGAARLSLDGDVMEGRSRRFFRRLGEGRYDMADLSARTGALGDFLLDAFARHGIDPPTATGVGYSNGANILANLLLTGRGPLCRMVLLRPLIPFRARPPRLGGARALIAGGLRDPICPPELTESLATTLAGAGARVEMVWSPGGHELDAGDLAATTRFLAAEMPEHASRD